MSDEQVQFLTEYDEWKANKRVSRDDLSPEAFLIDRAKEQALQKLIKIDELMEKFWEMYPGEDEDELSTRYNKLTLDIQTVLDE
jgi:hypothetical protein